jgi:hypothetical protein
MTALEIFNLHTLDTATSALCSGIPVLRIPEALPEVPLDAKLTAELVLTPNWNDDERLG